MRTMPNPKPRVSEEEVIVIIDRIVDHYWRDEQKDYVETPIDVDSPHVFCHLQELDRFRCELYERTSKRSRPK